MNDLIKITPNRARVESILKMVEVTIERITITDNNRFASLLTKDYYDVIRELIAVILILDGYKTKGEGAHKKQIEYLSVKYKEEIKRHQIVLIEDLLDKRNKIAYEGFFVPEDYISQRLEDLKIIIAKLKEIINNKLSKDH